MNYILRKILLQAVRASLYVLTKHDPQKARDVVLRAVVKAQAKRDAKEDQRKMAIAKVTGGLCADIVAWSSAGARA